MLGSNYHDIRCCASSPEFCLDVLLSPLSNVGCADPFYPSGFARVSAGMEWINNTVCGEVGEWCGGEDDDGNDCFNMDHADIHHITSVRQHQK